MHRKIDRRCSGKLSVGTRCDADDRDPGRIEPLERRASVSSRPINNFLCSRHFGQVSAKMKLALRPIAEARTASRAARRLMLCDLAG
jgi:hypothetical protein